jgi:hypothetical protein
MFAKRAMYHLPLARSLLLGMMTVLLVAFSAGAPAQAESVSLARTGQTICYDAAGATTSCTATGQDGELQIGVAWPAPRFTDNGDGTLTDRLTGLTWLADANCIAAHYPALDQDTYEADPEGLGDGLVSWAHALEFGSNLVNNVSYADCGRGHDDWRLPNVNELASLFNAEVADRSWLESQGFANIASGGYWSSTTHRSFLPANGWFVDIVHGQVSNTDKTDLGAVLPVRGGQTDGNADTNSAANVWRTGQTTSHASGDDRDEQAGVAWPEPRFSDHGDGTVTDQLTGLMWLGDANCIASTYAEVAANGRVSWSGALSFVSGINNGDYSDCGAGYDDWRLPNRSELHSLTDHGKTTGDALPEGHPFSGVATGSPSGYWSSTSYLTIAGWAWQWAGKSGDLTGAPKSSAYHVWPVRSTPSAPTGPHLAVTPSTIDFGDVLIDDTATAKTLTLRNSGTEPLIVSSMQLSDSAHFTLITDVGADACAGTSPTLAASSSCTVRLTFSPGALQDYGASLTIASNDPDTPSVALTLAGSGVQPSEPIPRIAVQPDSFDFGEVPSNETSDAQLFSIRSVGGATLNVTAINNQDPTIFQVDLGAGNAPCGALPLALDPGRSCSFSVRFDPETTRSYETIIYFHSDDPIHESLPLTLTGSGTPSQESGGCGCQTAESNRARALRGLILLLLGASLLGWVRRPRRSRRRA